MVMKVRREGQQREGGSECIFFGTVPLTAHEKAPNIGNIFIFALALKEFSFTNCHATITKDLQIEFYNPGTERKRGEN